MKLRHGLFVAALASATFAAGLRAATSRSSPAAPARAPDGAAPVPASTSSSRGFTPARVLPGRTVAPDPDEAAEASGPPQRLEPEDKSAVLVARLEDSGRGHAAWMDRVPEVLTAWRATQPELADGVVLGAPDCWRAGCAVVATYDPLAYAQLSQATVASDAFRTWPGWRMRSPPSTDDSGRVVVTWYLMGPDDAGSNQP